MRIVLLPSAYVPLIGGVEELTRRLARQLIIAGDEVEVWTTHPSGSPITEEVDGIRVRRFQMPMPPAKMRSLASFPAGGVGTVAELIRAFREFHPHVLHVQCFGVNGAYATLISHLTRAPLVISLQGETIMDDHDIYDRAISLRSALRLGLRRAAAVTGCSQFVLDDAVSRFGLAPARGRVIFNGVEAFQGDPTVVPVPFGRFVLCLGRLVRKKGFHLAIDAFSVVAQRYPDVGLVIAGGGPFQARLQDLVKTLRFNDRVHFTGPLNRAQVAWVMAHAEVFVMPSLIEPFGIVALEAWLAGCPLVASADGGVTEFVNDGVSGLVVNPRNTSQLAEAIMRLLTDSPLKEMLIRNASERVKSFDWALVADQYRHVYEDVVHASGAARSVR